MNDHFTVLEGFACLCDQRSYVVKGCLSLMGSTKENLMRVRSRPVGYQASNLKPAVGEKLGKGIGPCSFQGASGVRVPLPWLFHPRTNTIRVCFALPVKSQTYTQWIMNFASAALLSLMMFLTFMNRSSGCRQRMSGFCWLH